MIYTFSEIPETNLPNYTSRKKEMSTVLFSDGPIAPHAYFVPFSSFSACAYVSQADELKKSDRTFDLGGTWQIYFSPYGITSLDDEKCSWQKCKVPSSLIEIGLHPSTHTYGRKRKLKSKDPDLVQAVYRTRFTVNDLSPMFELSLERVIGAFEVFVNGQPCGFSSLESGSFDITDKIVLGENELTIALRNSKKTRPFIHAEDNIGLGIIGEVLLFARPTTHLVDYAFSSESENSYFHGQLHLSLSANDDIECLVSLLDGNKVHSTYYTKNEKEITLEMRDAFQAYSPENPYLYTAVVQIFEGTKEVECIRLPIGFYSTSIQDGIFYYCNKPFKIKGVQYRSVYNSDGTKMTQEDYRRELRQIKNYNFNTIEIGFPAGNQLLRLCTELGLFVIENFGIDFAELTQKEKLRNKILESAEFKDFLRLRCNEASATTKNYPCLLAFSLFGSSKLLFPTEICDEIIKKTNKMIIGSSDEILQLVSPSASDISSCTENNLSQAIFLEAYGDNFKTSGERLEEMLVLFENERHIMGGCISEYRDIIVNGNGSEGEGLFDSQNKPYPNADLCRYCFRPLVATLRDNQRIEIFNEYKLEHIEGHCVVSLISNDIEKLLTEFNISIPAQCSHFYAIPLENATENMLLKLAYYRTDSEPIASEVLPIVIEKTDEVQVSKLSLKQYIYSFNELGSMEEKNVLPARSYFVPCSQEEIAKDTDYVEERKTSDRVISLIGEWDFIYAGAFLPIELIPETQVFDKIRLPFSWESEGYEPLAFDQGYSFKQKKNKVEFDKKEKNTYGIYRKVFNIGDLSFRYFLSFAQVSGSIGVFVNGQFIGTSQKPFVEFDISAPLVLGENEVVIVVKKWNLLSFANGNPHFRATGLLGEINLIKRRTNGLFDYSYTVDQDIRGTYVNLALSFSDTTGKVLLQSKNNDGTTYEEIRDIEKETAFRFLTDTKNYSDECPELADVYIKVIENDFVTECTKIKIGKTIKQNMKGVFTLNNEATKIRGIVYNPVYNDLGKILSLQEQEYDLKLLKKYRFNAVQPTFEPSPEFLRLCQKLGLYVIYRMPVSPAFNKNARHLWNNKKFVSVLSDTILSSFNRVKAFNNILLYYFDCDKNNTVISKLCTSIKECTTAYVCAKGDYADMKCVSYPSVGEMIEDINSLMNNKPLFLANYAKVVGNNCADFKQYEEIIAQSPCCMGGCFAQFSDDIILGQGVKANGLFTSTRQQTDALKFIKYIYRPIRSQLVSDREIAIYNDNGFIDTSYMQINIVLVRDGHKLSSTPLNVAVPPKQTNVYNIFIDHIYGDMFVNVEYIDRETEELIYTEQHRLSEKKQTIEAPQESGTLYVTEFPSFLDIRFESGTIRFDKNLACISQYTILDKEILKSESVQKGCNGFTSNIVRPFARNFENKHFSFVRSEKRDFSWSRADGKINIDVETTLYLDKKESYVVQDKYIISSSGEIEVFSVLNPMRRNLPLLDCFGKQLRLHNRFGFVTYYGRGEGATYVDMQEHAPIGLYNFTVDQTFATVAKKEEAGNRCDVQYCLLSDEDGTGIMVLSKKDPFQLRVSPLSDKEIMGGSTEKQTATYVDINSFVTGIGTTNNGYPVHAYTYASKQYILHFSILPIHKGK